jgi:HD-GYP domain-containing protein (c-di-GMP phosphodiesterase class II)
MEEARLAEVVGALSLATDVAMGAPLELGLSTCLVATRLAEAMGCDAEETRRVYWVALLRHVGCTAGSHEMAALLGDEIAFHSSLTEAEWSTGEMLRAFVGAVTRDEAPLGKLRALGRFAAAAPAMKGGPVERCEVATRLAAELGLDEEIQRDVVAVYERWDGKGFPYGVKAATVGLAARIVCVAEAGEIFLRLEGVDGARAIVRKRSGSAYDPRVAECFDAHADALLDTLSRPDAWEAMLAAEPEPHAWLRGEALERALGVVADFADLKSPWTVGHSRGVAGLARAAAHEAGLGEEAARRVFFAGLVHDLGRVGVSAGIWAKEAELTGAEWEQVRLHPYTTGRVLDRAASLRSIGELAAAHHERCDGSGYHRAVPVSLLPQEARILAAADVFHALREERPHRAARDAAAAAAELRAEVEAGRLDGSAAEAVLAAAGQPRRRRSAVAGLTEREVEVLQLLARGLTTKQIAEQLVIARKTADAHVQHIYSKAGVTTRAAATVFALQHDLVAPLAR